MRYLWGHGRLGGLWDAHVMSWGAWWGHRVLIWGHGVLLRGHKELGRDMGRSCGATVGLMRVYGGYLWGHGMLMGVMRGLMWSHGELL